MTDVHIGRDYRSMNKSRKCLPLPHLYITHSLFYDDRKVKKLLSYLIYLKCKKISETLGTREVNLFSTDSHHPWHSSPSYWYHQANQRCWSTTLTPGCRWRGARMPFYRCSSARTLSLPGQSGGGAVWSWQLVTAKADM